MFFLFFVSTLGYLVWNVAEQIAPTTELTRFFACLSYPFISTIPVTWFLFTYQFTRGKERLSFPYRNMLFVIPGVTTVLVFTNSFHHLVWTSLRYVSVGNILAMQVEHGFWFYLHLAYGYVLIVLGAFLIIREYVKAPGLYTAQAFWMITGVLIPVLANIIYVFDILPWLVKDYTPLAFSFSVLCFFVGMFRYRFLELLPIARSTVVEQLRDGIVVLDRSDRIVDINPAAQKVVGCSTDVLGKDAFILSQYWEELALALGLTRSTKEEGELYNNSSGVTLSRTFGGEERFFRIQLGQIQNKKALTGRLITLSDITEENLLLKKIETMARTDEMTSLYNRRYFTALAEQEISRGRRYREPFSFVMFDLDHFKRINDTLGHPVGDAVIVRFAEILRETLREADIVGRVGGEEFAVVMPETPIELAKQVCERIREKVEETKVPLSQGEVTFTVSAGITELSQRYLIPAEEERSALDVLFDRADKALYEAKIRGRNRVVIS
jgi:diguanylate cyclase (GGDEF)-like protein/PAS domain S-box-containing protein